MKKTHFLINLTDLSNISDYRHRPGTIAEDMEDRVEGERLFHCLSKQFENIYYRASPLPESYLPCNKNCQLFSTVRMIDKHLPYKLMRMSF
jgi:hypothetical protein